MVRMIGLILSAARPFRCGMRTWRASSTAVTAGTLPAALRVKLLYIAVYMGHLVNLILKHYCRYYLTVLQW